MPSINARALSSRGPAAVAVGGIPAWVNPSSYSKGMSRSEGPWREIEYHVAWDQSDRFIDLLLPTVIFVGTPGAGILSYKLPHQYPNNPNLWCMEAHAVPGGVTGPDGLGSDPTVGKLVGADIAIIRARYQQPTFDVQGSSDIMTPPGVDPRPFARWTRRVHMETELLPASAVQQPDDKKQDVRFPNEYPVVEYTVSYHMMPYYPDPSIEAVEGKLNSGAFMGGARGCVRFMGVDAESEYDPAGNTVWTWTMTFLRKPWDWNGKVQNDGSGRDVMELVGGGNVYSYGDLTACFVPAGTQAP